jgi:5-methylcytosine-specific restriction protein A
MMKRPEYRSKEALAYRHLYGTARWQRLRARVLRTQPVCAMCREWGYITPATVCDHIDPKSKLSEQGFFTGPFQSLCATCHNGTKARIEAGGKGPQRLGEDGWPVG